eukprot:jgi/Ulvmu1/8108/UM040_0003.1
MYIAAPRAYYKMEHQASSSVFSFKKLTRKSTSYRQWAAQFNASMMTFGKQKWLTEEPAAENADDMKGDEFVRGRLLLAVDDAGLTRIIGAASTAMAAWDELRTEYESDLEARQHLLVGELHGVRQKTGQKYADYADRVHEILEQLEDTDFESGQQLACDQLIRGLKQCPERGALVMALTPLVPDGFTKLKKHLKSTVRLLDSGVGAGSSGRDDGGGRAMLADAKKQQKENRKCFHCGKVGHLKADCWQRKKDKEKPAIAMMARAGDSPLHADGAKMHLDSAATKHYVKDL